MNEEAKWRDLCPLKLECRIADYPGPDCEWDQCPHPPWRAKSTPKPPVDFLRERERLNHQN